MLTIIAVFVGTIAVFFTGVAILMAFESYIENYEFSEKEARVLHPVTVCMAFSLLFVFVTFLCISTVHLVIGAIGLTATAMLASMNDMVNKRVKYFI